MMRDYAHSHGNGNSRGTRRLGQKNTVLALDWRSLLKVGRHIFLAFWFICERYSSGCSGLFSDLTGSLGLEHGRVLSIPCTRAGSLTISKYIHLHWAGRFACMVKCKVYIHHHISFLSWCIMADIILPSSGCNAPDQIRIPRSKRRAHRTGDGLA